MKKCVLYGVLFVLVLSAFGCSTNGDPFDAVDEETRQGLIGFLESAALGGRGEYTITVEGEVGEKYVGDIRGIAHGAPSSAELIYYSFLDAQLIEVSRTQMDADGSWGPITVLYGPKALILMDGDTILGYWVTPRVFAMSPRTTVADCSDFAVLPRDSGLVALALIHGNKLQEAANLLAEIRPVHMECSGLPEKVDVFGRVLNEGIDVSATAWAGFAAAELAEITNNSQLWDEARAYAEYLSAQPIQVDADALVAGWLLFDKLKKKYPEYAERQAEWQPQSDDYHPLVGTWMILAGQDVNGFVDLSYQPESAAEKWLHYNVLAALNEVPGDTELDELRDVPGGKAVVDKDIISLEATSWMVLALSGGLRK